MLHHSPWLNFEKTSWPKLQADLSSEVAIIGGGISGIATLYYLVTTTQKNVVLIEKNTVASGATGHNAGLAIASIEKPASELVNMIGKQATLALFKELDEAFEDLHDIHQEIDLQDNLISFTSVARGFDSLSQFSSCVKEMEIGNKREWHYLVCENLKDNLPEDLKVVVEFVPHETILTTLKTIDRNYIAAAIPRFAFRAKRMNSAKFCYKVLAYLKTKFASRFSVYEETNICSIELYKNHSVLKHSEGIITADDVILCTNAYKDFTIWDHSTKTAYTKLQDSITPRIGYLAAFPDNSVTSYALGLSTDREPFNSAPYWYFSHAPHANHDLNHSCVIGGPEFDLHDSLSQEWMDDKKEKSLDLIKLFLKTTFKQTPDTLSFFWYGWMGYTSDGLRWVGPDSDHPHLWYNLACNGIGMVPAIAAAKRIAALMASSSN